MGRAIVDGVATDLDAARISVTDPAVTVGWSVFESIRVNGGSAPLLDVHLDRLAESCAAALIAMPDREVLRSEVMAVAGDGPLMRVRIELTGGGRRIVTGEAGDAERIHRPIRAVRGVHRDDPVLPGSVKHGSRASWIVAVRRSGADEVLLVDEHGRFTEGTTCSVLAVIDGVLWTAPNDGRILDSTTCGEILRRAEALGIPVRREGPPAEGPWDGLYVASALRDLAPVAELDGRPIPTWDAVGSRLRQPLPPPGGKGRAEGAGRGVGSAKRGNQTSQLLAMMRAKAESRTPADLLRQQAEDPFVQPSGLDPRVLMKFDAAAYEAAPAFEAVLLSPVAPLGMCGAVGPSSQDRILSTIRSTEVVSDPTNAMALLIAGRLRADPQPVRMCTVHQVVRAQKFAAKSGFSQHFRMFACAWAGGAGKEHSAEVDALVEQLAVHDRLLTAAEALGCSIPARSVEILSDGRGEALVPRVRARIGAELGHLQIREGRLEKGYYDGLRMLLYAGDVPIADVGRFDWMATLTSNRKWRFVASGIGLQLLPMLFTAGP